MHDKDDIEAEARTRELNLRARIDELEKNHEAQVTKVTALQTDRNWFALRADELNKQLKSLESESMSRRLGNAKGSGVFARR